jgi:hypothetical protein
MADLDEASFSRDWLNGCTREEMAALYGYTNLNAITKVVRRLGLPTYQEVQDGLREEELALTGGAWVPRGGIMVWVVAA